MSVWSLLIPRMSASPSLPPVIDFTHLSLAVVLWVHQGERFRAKSAWEVRPCGSPRAHTSCRQSCSVNVPLDPQINTCQLRVWVKKKNGRETQEAGQRVGAGNGMRRGGKKKTKQNGVIKKRKSWHLDYSPLSISFNSPFLSKISQSIHPLSPFISLCIISFLVPSARSSVSLLIPFSFNSRFFSSYTFSTCLTSYFPSFPASYSSTAQAFSESPTERSFDDGGLIPHSNP